VAPALFLINCTSLHRLCLQFLFFQHHSAPPFHVTHLYLRRGAILLDLRVGTLLEEEEEDGPKTGRA